jgi:uncharacterized membrane protein (UPF0127 family)
MPLLNHSTGEVIAKVVEKADTFIKRFRGLMLRGNFSNHAMLFTFKKPGRYSVHTMFMRFPIDLVYLDENFAAVEIKKNLKPWRFYRPKSKAKYLIEIPSNVAKIEVGNRLYLE